MTFNFDAMPWSSQAVHAELEFTISAVTGDPFRNMGPLRISRVQPYPGISYGIHDWPEISGKSVLTAKPTSVPFTMRVDVTDLVKDDVADIFDRNAYLRLSFPHNARGGIQEFIKVLNSRTLNSEGPRLWLTYTYN